MKLYCTLPEKWVFHWTIQYKYNKMQHASEITVSVSWEPWMANNFLKNLIMINLSTANKAKRLADIVLTKFEERSCAKKHPVTFLIFHTFVYIFPESVKVCGLKVHVISWKKLYNTTIILFTFVQNHIFKLFIIPQLKRICRNFFQDLLLFCSVSQQTLQNLC